MSDMSVNFLTNSTPGTRNWDPTQAQVGLSNEGGSKMNKPGRNDRCPCGSGKKYKRCCLGVATEVGTHRDYLAKCASALRRYEGRLRAEVVGRVDRSPLDLSLECYEAAVADVEEHGDVSLMIMEVPGMASKLVRESGDANSRAEIVQQVEGGRGFDAYRTGHLEIWESELAGGLASDDFSFHLPPAGPFPILFRLSGTAGYCTQYVADGLVFSPRLDEMVSVPIIHHSSSLADFVNMRSFCHEWVHVLQRVLRKQRIPFGKYLAFGKVRISNPVAYVRTGIEDELEAERIMAQSGYWFRIEPALYHKKNLLNAFRDYPAAQAKALIREGIEAIPVEKYQKFVDKPLLDVLLGHFC